LSKAGRGRGYDMDAFEASMGWPGMSFLDVCMMFLGLFRARLHSMTETGKREPLTAILEHPPRDYTTILRTALHGGVNRNDGNHCVK